jgi:hypothetical protein
VILSCFADDVAASSLEGLCKGSRRSSCYFQKVRAYLPLVQKTGPEVAMPMLGYSQLQHLGWQENRSPETCSGLVPWEGDDEIEIFSGETEDGYLQSRCWYVRYQRGCE